MVNWENKKKMVKGKTTQPQNMNYKSDYADVNEKSASYSFSIW